MLRTAPDLEVAIIGAGLGGIGAAIELRRAGIEQIAIFERADDIGGTWNANTYPGLTVDIPAHAYQFSYELNPEWRRTYASGSEVKAYVDHCAEKYEVRRLVRLDSEVAERQWDPANGWWRLTVNGEQVTARWVISAVGAFINPKPIEIPGVERFGGELLRSADWDHSVELTGKRIAIIGTGASAVQIVPIIAKQAARLDVYQRTAIWVGPKLDPPNPRPLRFLLRRVPAIERLLYRSLSAVVEAGLIGIVVRHDRFGWVTRIGGWLGRNLWYRQIRDPTTRRKLTPDYEIGCKRPIVSNSYLRAFNRDNVELVTAPIERITERGVRTVDGDEREVDVLICATGFRVAGDPANYRINPVRGRDGFDLAEHCARNRATSYHSVSVRGLPNHFFIFGPYGWVGAAWHQLVESASRHIIRVIEEAGRRQTPVVEVRRQLAEDWTADAVSRLGRSLWHVGNCAGARSYYFDHHGDTPFLRPTSARRALADAANFPLDAYEYRGLAAAPEPAAAMAGNVEPDG